MNKCVILILCFFRLKNEEEMLSVENEFLDVEGLNPEENAKDGHSRFRTDNAVHTTGPAREQGL